MRKLGSALTDAEVASLYRPICKFWRLGGVLSQGSVHLDLIDQELGLELGPDYDRLVRMLQGVEPYPDGVYQNIHGPKRPAVVSGTLGGERFFSLEAVERWREAQLTGARFQPVEISSGETYQRLIVLGRSGPRIDISPRLFRDDKELAKGEDALWDRALWSGDDIFTVGDSMIVWTTDRARKALKGLRAEWTEVRVVGVPHQLEEFPIGMSEARDLGLA